MPSLEAQLTNLADEIAYNSHDVDDGLRTRSTTWQLINLRTTSWMLRRSDRSG